MAFVITNNIDPRFWIVNEEGTWNSASFNSLEQAEYWCNENGIEYTIDQA